MKEKFYPFSFKKHGHDIEFRKNRLYLEICRMRDGEVPFDDVRYDMIEKEMDQLNEILDYCRGPVSPIPGRLYGVAKDACAFASLTRAESCAARGRYDLLQHC